MATIVDAVTVVDAKCVTDPITFQPKWVYVIEIPLEAHTSDSITEDELAQMLLESIKEATKTN